MAKVFFDFDGVLVRSRFQDKSFLWTKDIETDLGLPPEVRDELFQQPEWNEIISGRRNFREKLAATFLHHGIQLGAEEFVQFWLSKDLNWYPEVLELATDLKNAGHLLYVATNQDTLRGRYIRQQKEVTALFSDVFTSADLGVCKPSSDFYRQIREQYFAGSAKDLVVVDDDQRNIDAAIQDGWRGCCFNPDIELSHSIEFLRAKLGSLLI
jgi:putative hydrolase of the HAD superfamily